MELQVGGRPQSRLAVPGANGQWINRGGGGRGLGARLRPSTGQSGETASEPASAGGRLPRGRSFEGARGVAWLSGPLAFCSVTELLPWPESGAAAARSCRAQFAARAGSHPGPTPTQPGQVPHSGADDRGRYRWGEGRGASGRDAEPSVSGQVRAGAGERHPAPATGGAPGSWAPRPSGTRGSGRVRFGAS